MRILVLAIGRLKQGAEADLAARYAKRAEQAGRSIGLRPVDVIEIRESRAADPAKRMIEESIALANLLPEGATTILLDERGENIGSAAFAERLTAWRDGGVNTLACIIGGPDGLAPTLREQARIRIAFGAATWPHQLARIMLLEQIYRAMTIMTGHPYHRV